MKRIALALALLIACSFSAMAQNVTVIGPITPGDVPIFNSTTVIKDSGVPGGSAGFANPTASVGLTAVNGSALAAMRSDAAPPLSASVQSALTGTNNGLLFGTGSFGFGATAAPSSAGTIVYWNGSNWVLLAGNNSGTQVLSENSSGVPSWTSTGTTVLTEPQGRLTLVSNTPVMTTSNAAVTTLRYDCYIGNQVPYFNGSSDTLDTISSCEVADTMVSAASAGQVVSGQVYDVWWVHSGANRICLAMSSSSGGGGGWASDTGGSSTARGTGYSQLDTTTRPYATNKNSVANCFNGATNYGSVSANQATYLGTVLGSASANGAIDWVFGSIAAGGGASTFGLWNAYNREPVGSSVRDSTDTWSSAGTTATWRAANNSATARVTFVKGANVDAFWAQYNAMGNAGSSTSQLAGIGLDSTIGFCGTTAANGAVTVSSFTATCTAFAGVGLHFLSAVEATSNTTVSTFYGDTGTPTIFQTGLNVQLRQ